MLDVQVQIGFYYTRARKEREGQRSICDHEKARLLMNDDGAIARPWREL